MRIEEGKNIWIETEKEGFEAQVAKAGKHTFFATDKIHGIVFCSETLRSRSIDAIAYPSESAAGRNRRKKLND